MTARLGARLAPSTKGTPKCVGRLSADPARCGPEDMHQQATFFCVVSCCWKANSALGPPGFSSPAITECCGFGSIPGPTCSVTNMKLPKYIGANRYYMELKTALSKDIIFGRWQS
ncbi:hypothetical protein CEXT_34811 [Caerostris extrusa]|uniref:Uncharacterized protein n=1 Tax=Caerostris extrusa TaxID=172846 RepID=A0AAV4VTX6_CAEEX|nr:hypothetical protein CEXT_34811 [Caerostris extrusa]